MTSSRGRYSRINYIRLKISHRDAMMVIGHLIVICLSQLLNVRRFTMFIIKRKNCIKISNSDIKIRWQWGWWHRYVGDFMMVTDFRCWWQNHYVGDFFRYVGDVGHQHLKLVTNTFNLQHPSPTSMLPKILRPCWWRILVMKYDDDNVCIMVTDWKCG